jgi:RimJ/RimL family protein N-acetyltransferase
VTAPQEISLRPVQPADEAFLLSVYASTRAQEMAQVPWSAEQKDAFVRMQFAAQQRHYASEYPAASHDIICLGNTPVGRLYLSREAERIHILDITVLPAHRNAGIGSFVLRQLLQEAGAAQKPVTIYVENFNPSLSLFRRLGFEPIAEKEFNLLLRRLPASGSGPQHGPSSAHSAD